MAQRALTPTEFANLVNAITAAFGDPTRRAIYLLIHENRDGLTANQVADATSVHSNVARHHLDKLVGGGYLEVSRQSTGGAGRPAKIYRAPSEGLVVEFDLGHDDILITLLGKALSMLGAEAAAQLAEEVGIQFGRRMAAAMGGSEAAQSSFRAALHLVADALSAHGFAAHAEPHGDELRIVSSHCPFGDVAIEHPVICAVDRGMVKGLLSSLYGETEVALSASLPAGDEECVAAVISATDGTSGGEGR